MTVPQTTNAIYLSHLKEEYGIGKYKPVKITDADRAKLFLELNSCFIEAIESEAFGCTYFVSTYGEVINTTTYITTTTNTENVITLLVGEALEAGAFVNIYEQGGNTKVRRADASLGRRAHGFVKQAYSVGQTASIYQSGLNTVALTTTVGNEYYLSTGGAVIGTPNESWDFAQRLGVAISSSVLLVEIEEPYNYA